LGTRAFTFGHASAAIERQQIGSGALEFRRDLAA
jgi:hypothetical protein